MAVPRARAAARAQLRLELARGGDELHASVLRRREQPLPGDLRRPVFRLAGRWASAETYEQMHERAKRETSSSARTPAMTVVSAWRMNAVPVAEFTQAMITLAAKDAFWAFAPETTFTPHPRTAPTSQGLEIVFSQRKVPTCR